MRRTVLDVAINLVGAGLFLASGVAIHAMAGARLSSQAYGDFGLVLTILITLNIIVSSGLGLGVSRDVALARTDQIRPVAMGYLRRAFLASLVAAAALLALSFPFRTWLSLTSPTSWFFLAAGLVIIYAASAVAVGALNGAGLARRSGLALIGAHVSKVVLGFILLSVGLGGFGLLLAYGAANLLPALYGVVWILRQSHGPLARGVRVGGFILGAGVFSIAINLLASLDVVLAKAALEPATAGVYVAATTLAKIPVTLAGTAALVLYPFVARAHAGSARPGHGHGESSLAMLLLSSIVLAAGLGVLLLGSWMLVHLYGPEFKTAVPLLRLLVGGFVLLAIASGLHHMALAAGGSKLVSRLTLAAAATFALTTAVLADLFGTNGLAAGVYVGGTLALLGGALAFLRRPSTRALIPVGVPPAPAP